MNKLLILVITFIMSLNCHKFSFEVTFFKTTEWWLLKYLNFNGELKQDDKSLALKSYSFWYIFADYFGKVSDGRIKLSPKVLINDIPVQNNIVWIQTYRDINRDDLYWYADTIDFGVVCDTKGDMNYVDDNLLLDENRFKWTISVKCDLSPSVDIKSINGQQTIVLKDDQKLMKKVFKHCDDPAYRKLDERYSESVNSVHKPSILNQGNDDLNSVKPKEIIQPVHNESEDPKQHDIILDDLVNRKVL